MTEVLFYSKILLHEVPLQRHYIRDGAKQIYSQGTPSECDSKSFMYHIIKPEQNTEDEKLTSGKQVSVLLNVNLKTFSTEKSRLCI